MYRTEITELVGVWHINDSGQYVTNQLGAWDWYTFMQGGVPGWDNESARWAKLTRVCAPNAVTCSV